MLSLVFSRMLFAHTTSEEEFKLVRTDKGISLYERWIPNAEDEKVREIKATFVVRADLAGISRLMTSPAMGTDWNVNAKEYNVIPTTTENTWITYIKYSIPWPFEDQDCCLLYHLRKEEQYAEITFESTAHSRFPVYKNITRISGAKGKWMLQDMGNGNMRVTYLISTNRSKKVPRWISDPIVQGNLIETMTRFKTLAEKNK
ncbi:START domain-containing protein [Chitinophaga niabensis]|uniref:START domain-containing protein n=1 Tax=Chitinophaga niabensis TaxID=536979 RepID=A0A1N6DLA5_9BACT|nr:START domain-containing protein [Chitinophaga niabensis]SIN71558.1 START domain-containing protein [Chitinophaga niabensis]